jgi:hypothetical protein
MLPPEIVALIAQKERAGWSGAVVLNMKDGRVLSYELTEKHRLTSQEAAPRRT